MCKRESAESPAELFPEWPDGIFGQAYHRAVNGTTGRTGGYCKSLAVCFEARFCPRPAGGALILFEIIPPKPDLLADLSHEIRTPLTSILGYADILMRQGHDQDVLDGLQVIQRNGLEVLDILNDSLDLAKIAANNLRVESLPVSLNQLLEGVQSTISPKFKKKGIELHISVATGPPATVLSDRLRLRQVLVHLLSYALSHKSQGRVTLKLAILNPSWLEFLIEDTRAPLARPGSWGRALDISHNLIRLLGGTLEFVPGQGESISLRVSIPTGCLDGDESMEADPPSHTILVGAKVLVVDDQADIRDLFKSYLCEAGALVATAEDGQKALDYLQENRVDVVVLDMHMPRLDGYATARELRRRKDPLPILAVTAAGDPDSCLEAGCSSFLSKPLDRKALLNRVAELTGKSQGRRVLLVEDNVLAAAAVSAMLNKLGCYTEVAYDGKQALEKSLVDPPPDFVLIDLGLPDMDGWALLKQLKRIDRLKNTRFVAHTGQESGEVRDLSGQLAFDDIVQKPVDRPRLWKLLCS